MSLALKGLKDCIHREDSEEENRDVAKENPSGDGKGKTAIITAFTECMIDPLQHYQTFQEEYDRLWERTAATGKVFETADFETRQDLLDQAVRFGLLSTQTKVPQQESAYQASLDIGSATTIRARLWDNQAPQITADTASPPSTFNATRWRDEYGETVYKRALTIWDELAGELRAAGVNYANNKAAYIVRNSVDPDYETIVARWDEKAYDRAHRLIADDFLGVSLSKGAYAMGKLGCEEKLCIDRHVAAAAGIDPDDLYQGTVVDRYEDQCDRVEAAFSELSELPRPLFRWVVFDAHRYTEDVDSPVTTHDVLFDSLPLEEVVVDSSTGG